MGYRRGYYKKDGTYVQGHYTNTNLKSFLNKNNKGCTTVVTVLMILTLVISCSDSSSKQDCPTKNCSDFSTQSQAQATFNSDRDCYKNLDADSDGTASENLTN